MDRDMSISLYHLLHPCEDGHKMPSGKAIHLHFAILHIHIWQGQSCASLLHQNTCKKRLHKSFLDLPVSDPAIPRLSVSHCPMPIHLILFHLLQTYLTPV